MTRNWHQLLANLEFSLSGHAGRHCQAAFRMSGEAIDRKLLTPHGDLNVTTFDLNRVDEETSLTYKFKIQK